MPASYVLVSRAHYWAVHDKMKEPALRCPSLTVDDPRGPCITRTLLRTGLYPDPMQPPEQEDYQPGYGHDNHPLIHFQ